MNAANLQFAPPAKSDSCGRVGGKSSWNNPPAGAAAQVESREGFCGREGLRSRSRGGTNRLRARHLFWVESLERRRLFAAGQSIRRSDRAALLPAMTALSPLAVRHAMVVQPDGRIVIAGQSGDDEANLPPQSVNSHLAPSG